RPDPASDHGPDVCLGEEAPAAKELTNCAGVWLGHKPQRIVVAGFPPRARARCTSSIVNCACEMPADPSPPDRPAVGLKSGFGFTSRMYGLLPRIRKSTRA